MSSKSGRVLTAADLLVTGWAPWSKCQDRVWVNGEVAPTQEAAGRPALPGLSHGAAQSVLLLLGAQCPQVHRAGRSGRTLQLEALWESSPSLKWHVGGVWMDRGCSGDGVPTLGWAQGAMFGFHLLMYPSCIFNGRTDAEAETPVLWPPDGKSWLTGKDPDAGEDWRQEEKGTREDEMVGWHHRLDRHEFEQAPAVGDV